MGTYYTLGASRADVIAELLTTQPYMNAENKTIQRRILAHCLKGNVLWTVNEVLIDGALADRWIGCDLLVCYRRNGATTWGYKPMDEDSHPYYYTCPLRYLDLASPHDGSQYSTEWREKVRAYWAEVATRREGRHERLRSSSLALST